MSQLAHRYELLFIYECSDCNPNGDPLEENRPRTDSETGQATVTDVRIKRTIRDYFLAQQPDVEQRLASGMEVLIRDTLTASGTLSEGKDRAEQFISAAIKGKKGEEKRQVLEQTILQNCIDARLFGAALPLGKGEASLQITGPVQFSAFNRSLHRVAPQLVQQTAAYAGKANSQQKSFAERWLLPYAVISAYAVVNENAARTTGMSEADLQQLLRGLWYGTAELNTHSKIGHQPLLLLVLQQQPGHRLGALSQRLSLSDQSVTDTALRSCRDFSLNISELRTALQSCTTLHSVRVLQDSRLVCRDGERSGSFLSLLEQAGVTASALSL